MSLIIVKTNKNKNTHSIFCDGLSCSGNEIITKNARKIANTNKDGYNILIGCVGTSSLGRHIRINCLFHIIFCKCIAGNNDDDTNDD